jgi:hypothetical protein
VNTACSPVSSSADASLTRLGIVKGGRILQTTGCLRPIQALMGDWRDFLPVEHDSLSVQFWPYAWSDHDIARRIALSKEREKR